MALTVPGGSFKKALLLVGAAVVHYNDMLKALFYKAVNHGAELIVRVQGGQDYGKSCSAILYNFTHTILRKSPMGIAISKAHGLRPGIPLRPPQ